MKHTFIKLFRAIILVSASFIMLPSCSDYLDVVPDNIPTLDHAFADRFACEGFLFTCYSYLPRYGYVYGVPDFLSSDEFFTYDTPLNRMDRTTINIALGLQSVSDPAYNTWDGTRQARPLYQAIRDCNIFLENVDRPYDLEEYEKVRWVAEVNFLKAFYHFHMMQCYGPIILMDNNMPVSATPDEVAQYRTPFDECVDYVSNLLDIAAKDLPPTIVDRSNELGRATRPMALALKARLLAMAASPLFNGNSDYVNVVDNRGVKLFNTTFDQEKWVKAANACKEAIEAAEQADFGLLQEQDVQQQYALNDTLKQQFNLRMILYSKWNKEMLWASVRGNYKNDDNGIQDVSGCKISMKELGQVHVRQTLAPTFSLVETYYTRNGVPINEDKDFDYNSRYLTRMATRQDRWYIREGEETANLHFDREPRFYSSIGFDRAIWWGNGSYDFSDANYADDS
ncbi:MAG: RagB/SusD family nutrient uptake outer membrane protein [Tannerella sp.]|jgi:hypothetical protein|nr:RagB/SusD family nutrient uptake outer membrane protein [Tannerella sp.]